MFRQIVKVFAFPRWTIRWLVNAIYLSGLTLAITGSVALSSTAQTASVGGGLDCNGWSPISRNVRPMVCTDPHGGSDKRFYDNGWYIGHDEPDIQFYSSRPGSANNMIWRMTLPQRDPVPTQSGSSVANFEL